jgi:hypothetical protein
MHFFEYKDQKLHCEGVPIEQIAERVGTPFYLYSYKTLVRHFTVFNDAFEGIPHLICYSAKANSNLALIRISSILAEELMLSPEGNSTGPSKVEQTQEKLYSQELERGRTKLNMH